MRAWTLAAACAACMAAPVQAAMLGELRGGVMADTGAAGSLFDPQRFENANVEFVFNPVVDTYIAGSFSPHVGATANFSGGESFAYAGLTYHLPIMVLPVFVEAGVGGALSSHALGAGVSLAGADRLRCSALIHAEGSVGFDFAGMADLMLTAEHYFPVADCGAGSETGATNIGARLGISF